MGCDATQTVRQRKTHSIDKTGRLEKERRSHCLRKVVFAPFALLNMNRTFSISERAFHAR
jgi:hypothetical protein